MNRKFTHKKDRIIGPQTYEKMFNLTYEKKK